MAGSISRPRISDINPDLNSLKLLPKFTKVLFEGGDNKLLKFVIKELENLGLKFYIFIKLFQIYFLALVIKLKSKYRIAYLKIFKRGP